MDTERLDNNEIHRLLGAKDGSAFTQTIQLPPIQEDDSPLILSETPSTQVMERRTESGLQSIITSDTNLARDLATFGDIYLEEILQVYGLTHEQLEQKRQSPSFQTMYLQFRNDFEKDKHGGIRARAASYLDVLMEQVFRKSMASDASAQQVLKSAQFMAGLADAMPKGTNPDGTAAGGGATVVFNIGRNNPLIKDVSSIDTKERT